MKNNSYTGNKHIHIFTHIILHNINNLFLYYQFRFQISSFGKCVVSKKNFILTFYVRYLSKNLISDFSQ